MLPLETKVPSESQYWSFPLEDNTQFQSQFLMETTRLKIIYSIYTWTEFYSARHQEATNPCVN